MQAARIALILSAIVLSGLFFRAHPALSASSERPLEPEAIRPSDPFPALPEIAWTLLAPGLELGLAVLPESREHQRDAAFVVLRIDPAKHHFSLHMASHAGLSQSLPGWCQEADLRAGINASMYLPDNITSTGYMRSGYQVNNSNIGNNLGAFFVAASLKGNARPADILERDTAGWREILHDYSIVVQNYRLIDSRGNVLWPEGGTRHSIAAVGTDGKGRILFLLSQEPLTATRFARYLKSFPLGVKTVMYVEGGSQAGIFIRIDDREADPANPKLATSLPGASSLPVPGGVIHVWKGRQTLLNLPGNPQAALPNIIGIRR